MGAVVGHVPVRALLRHVPAASHRHDTAGARDPRARRRGTWCGVPTGAVGRRGHRGRARLPLPTRRHARGCREPQHGLGRHDDTRRLHSRGQPRRRVRDPDRVARRSRPCRSHRGRDRRGLVVRRAQRSLGRPRLPGAVRARRRRIRARPRAGRRARPTVSRSASPSPISHAPPTIAGVACRSSRPPTGGSSPTAWHRSSRASSAQPPSFARSSLSSAVEFR